MSRFRLVGTFLWTLAFAAGCSTLPTEHADPKIVSLLPEPVARSQAFVQLEAGFLHSCALRADGAAFCWGANDYSQLGAHTTDLCNGRPCSKEALEVEGGLRFTKLAAGWVQNCGLTVTGRAFCWGGGPFERRGYLGNGMLVQSATPVLVETDSVLTALSIGDGHACALTRSGVAMCWGQNGLGQLGDGTREDRATPVPVLSSLRFRSIVAGANHTCAITSANEAYCWGDNRFGQLGTGDVEYNSLVSATDSPSPVEGNTTFDVIVAGWQHTCAISTSGETLCWGRNDSARQLGDDSQVTHRGIPQPIAGDYRFTELHAGPLSTCGSTAWGETWCWGGNYYGTLGNGEIDEDGIGHPVRAMGGPFTDVAIGQGHACGLERASVQRLWCWGDRSVGQY